uniref:Uncharacterized protein n=1 Tax=Arundo donax TaxID=35708 RepID=A0A0A9HHE8_ARUDO
MLTASMATGHILQSSVEAPKYIYFLLENKLCPHLGSLILWRQRRSIIRQICLQQLKDIQRSLRREKDPFKKVRVHTSKRN